jgi:glycosyltransferase involved in cell wall biosynthesis
VEKGVDLLLRTALAQRTGMRLFNTYRRPDPRRSWKDKARFQAWMARSLWADLRRVGPGLVHVKSSSGVNFLQCSLYCSEARLRGLPVILQVHSGRFEAFYRSSVLPLRAWIRHTLHAVDRVVVLSEYWRERMRHIAPRARVRVVPNGLGRDEIEDLKTRTETRRTQVFFLGTGNRELNRDKGLDDLLAVLPALTRRHPAARWVIAGLEDPEANWRRFRSAWNLAGVRLDNIRFLPTIDARRKVSLLRESSILVMPSLFENMPNLLLEGMAAGMGVVATQVGAIPEMLNGGRGGIVIDPGDRRALEAGLDRLLSDPHLVRRQGRHNETRVASHYTMSVVEDLFDDLYHEVARRDRKVPRPSRHRAPLGQAAGAPATVLVAPVPEPRLAFQGSPSSGFVGVRRLLSREAVGLSAGILLSDDTTLGAPPGVPTALPVVSDSNLPDSRAFLSPPRTRPAPGFIPLAPKQPEVHPVEPGPNLLLQDCPDRQKQLD